MKPAPFSALTIVSLLAASSLCVGIRSLSDQRKRELISPAGERGASTMNAVDGAARPGRPVNARDLPLSESLEMRFRSIIAISNSADRRRAILSLMDGLGPSDWVIAIAELQKVAANSSATEAQLLMEGWAEVDPLAAMAWAGTRVSGSSVDGNHTEESIVFGAWLAKDRGAAIAYLLGPSGNVAQRWYLGAMTVRSFAGDLRGLSGFLEQVPESNRVMMVQQGQPGFAGVPLKELKKWIDTLSPELKKLLLGQVMTGLTQLEEKRELMSSYPEELGPEYQYSIYSTWVKTDATAALEALEQLPPGPGHAEAVTGAGIALAEIHRFPEAVEIARRFSDEIKDQYYNEVLLRARPEERQLAAEATSGVKDESYRFNELHTQLMMWSSEDPAAMHEWIRTHDVPELLRQEYGGK